MKKYMKFSLMLAALTLSGCNISWGGSTNSNSVASSEDLPISSSVEEPISSTSVSSSEELPPTSVSVEAPSASLEDSTSSINTPSESVKISSTTPDISSVNPITDAYEVVKPSYTTRDNMENQEWNTINTTGTQKMLIVPVKFSDGPTWTSAMLSNLNTIFFGEANQTSWHSVKSYFEESSYGQLTITGEVTDVLNVNLTVSKYNQNYIRNSYDYDPGYYIGTLFHEKMSGQTNKLKEYDQDNDGYVDGIVFCYSNAYNASSSSAYWAWCSSAGFEPSTTAPTFSNYMWVSYQFMNDSYGGTNAPKGIEAHTYIHESGHMFGLDDYYCYDDDNAWDCAGDRDMQAYNIGDHNIYSKMSLGWVNPYHVTDSCDIKLRSSAKYGDAILIKDNWNKTIFDEYILIEYYTPEGLNEQDSKYNYDSRNKMFTTSGLRIYHVDSRLVKDVRRNDYTGVISNGGYSSTYIKGSTMIGASNSISYSFLTTAQNPSKTRLLHLIDSGNRNTLTAGVNGTGGYGGISSIKIDPNKTLWTEGQSFSAKSAYFVKGNDTFNDGSKVGYTISVGETKDGMITVHIAKNK